MRGPKVFKGYWRDPEATATAFAGGWFHTGDIGVRDEDGYLFIVDRLKDMIVSGGENIAGSEVERVLYEHDAVLEAAVVARPDERWGEVPVAHVVRREGVVGHGRRAARPLPGPAGQVQGAEGHHVPRRPPAQPIGQGAQARAARRSRERHDEVDRRPMTTTIELTKLTDTVGAEVHGVDVDRLLNDDDIPRVDARRAGGQRRARVPRPPPRRRQPGGLQPAARRARGAGQGVSIPRSSSSPWTPPGAGRPSTSRARSTGTSTASPTTSRSWPRCSLRTPWPSPAARPSSPARTPPTTT